MKLIDDWKTIAPKLWSVRLTLLAALASAIEVGVSTWLNGQPPLFAMVACVVSLGAGAARVIAQPKLFE